MPIENKRILFQVFSIHKITDMLSCFTNNLSHFALVHSLRVAYLWKKVGSMFDGFCYHGNKSTILPLNSILKQLLKFLVHFTLLE